MKFTQASELFFAKALALGQLMAGSMPCRRKLLPPYPSSICTVSRLNHQRIVVFHVTENGIWGRFFEHIWQA
jgi:hypothetical protein